MSTRSLSVGKKRGTNPNRLTTKQRVAIDEWFANGMNGAGACRVAGYSQPATAWVKLIRDPKIVAYIEKRLTEINEGQELRKAELIGKMKRLNDFNLMKYARSSRGDSLVIDEEHYDLVAEMIGDCVTKIKVTEKEDETGIRRSIEIELMSKDKMFELEARYRGLLIDKIQAAVTVGTTEDLIHRLREEAEAGNVVGEDTIDGMVVK